MTTSADERLVRRAVVVATRLGGGGLNGLRESFGRVGEGAVFDSWVAAGPNMPVTPAAIRVALGQAFVAMTHATGQDADALAVTLADVLPRIVDELTPDGRLPSSRPGLLARWRALWRGQA